MTTIGPTDGGMDSVKRAAETQEPSRDKSSLPVISLIVPTRNEAGNIRELVSRIERVTTGISIEIIFVDDSTDETPEVIRDVSRHSMVSVSLIHRPHKQRNNGLAGAVVEGIRAATGEWIGVMDSDLQHPPELIPKLLKAARDTGDEIAVASRYIDSGEAPGLGSMRTAMSRACSLAARLFFPRRIRNITDPMSGFFIARREAIDTDRLQPRGFKILLEILVRFPHLGVTEIPFQFQARHSGGSKASLREGFRYLNLLLTLRFGGLFRRFTRFGAVGASGLVVNLAILAAFTDVGGFYYLISAVLATQVSTLWNFTLTETWVFGDRARDQSRIIRLGRFLLVNNSALLVRGPFLFILTSGLGVHYLISNLLTLLALGLARYLIADGWIWAGSLLSSTRKWFNYDIHGILRIASEVRLPELEYFLTPESVEQPDVRVRIGSYCASDPEPPEAVEGNHNHFRYEENLGRFGFWIEMTRGKIIDVMASPLIKHSPHVLYTNVVEPILRWTLVQKGYALVHGACVAGNGKGVLVTAGTDTGKTTTILKLLSHQPFDFLSDDMVILHRNGRVLCYPKPLTISRHTLEAVNGAPLSRWERVVLQVQSRVHSKSGRQTALTLARLPLPMATVNTVAQMIVPPPKYSIERLIPGTEIGREAHIRHLMVIELGPDHQVSLDPTLAEETLLKNCEDAYGFPPYPALERFLPTCNGVDLRRREREIICEGLNGCDATLIRSRDRSWWEELPGILDGIGANGKKPVERKTASGDTPTHDLARRPGLVDGTSTDTGQSIAPS